MKIAIFSDLHDNKPNLERFQNWCRVNEIESLICCGDITNDITLDSIASNFVGTIFLIRGNMDIYVEDQVYKYDNIDYLGRFGTTNIEGKEVGICHEPVYIGKILETNKPKIIFYGHTHKPWIEKRDKVDVVNPGTLGGVFLKASFAYWNSETGELKLIVLDQL